MPKNSTRQQAATRAAPTTNLRILTDAPQELVVIYDHRNKLPPGWINDRVRSESIAMLGRLISDGRMVNVWADLSKRSRELSRSANYGAAIFSAAQSALILSVAPRRSSSEEMKVFERTSDLIGELIRHINEADMLGPCHVEEFMTDDEIRELASLMHEPHQTLPDNINLGPDDGLGTSFNFTRVNTWAVIPALPELLRRLKEKLKARKPSELWKQPNNKHAFRNLFALQISRHLKREYKRFWDEHVAAFTNVALGLNEDGPYKKNDPKKIDAVDVQQLRRRLPKNNRKRTKI